MRATLFLLLATSTSAFCPSGASGQHRPSFGLQAKGFGDAPAPNKKQKSQGQQKRDAESSKYDELAASGGQEYTIFVRQFGDTNPESWLPCGGIAVPRGEQVSNAVFANEAALKESIVKMYPRLKGDEDEFEFGSNLKVYPDDPIDVVRKEKKASGMSFKGWINTLLSPIDDSQVR